MDELPLPWPLDEKYEVWRPIPGFEGYQASSLGRVRSFWRYGSAGLGDAPRIKSVCFDSNGYARTGVRWNGGTRPFLVHRLVLLAFAGEPEADQQVARHLDGNPANNSINNLAWGTQKENGQDMVRHGTQRPPGLRGESHGSARLTCEIVCNIRESAGRGESQRQIAARHGVSKSAVKHVLRRRTWAHLS